MSGALRVATTVGCGLNAGVFFAFSSFVMPGLRRLPPATGMASMQSINTTAVTPAFMTVLFGTAALCAASTVAGVRRWDEPAGRYEAIGGIVFVVGTIGVTMAYNVPRNDRLAKLAADAPASADRWSRYLTEWTAANHVRTGSAAVATVLLALAAHAR